VPSCDVRLLRSCILSKGVKIFSPFEAPHFTLVKEALIEINVKKLWFIHELTAHDTSKTAKITKKVITHQHIA